MILEGPLQVKLWTDKNEYKDCDKIKVFLKGNKPFYARVVYRDAGSKIVQILPNRYRSDNYFNGNVVYEIPSGPDKFELAIDPPYGSEEIRVFASTAELGDIQLSGGENVFIVQTADKDLGIRSRGIKIVEKSGKKPLAAEFSENSVSLTTGGNCADLKQVSRKMSTEDLRMVIQAGHASDIYAVSFTPDGKNVLTGSIDKTIKLWDHSGKIIRTYRTPGDVLSVQFSPDGQYILSGSRDGSIILRDLSGKVIFEHNVAPFAFQTFFSGDGKNILSFSHPQNQGDGTVKIWDLKGKLLRTFSKSDDAASRWGDIRVSPDGKYVVTTSLYENRESALKLWKTDGTLIKAIPGIKDHPSIQAIAPGAGMMAVHFSGPYERPSPYLEFWDGEGKVLAKLVPEGRDDYFQDYSFSPDGSRMMMKRSEGKWQLWKKDGSRLIKIGDYPGGHISNIVFSPDGKYLLLTGQESSRLLRASDGVLVQSLQQPSGYYKNGIAALDPAGKRIVLVNNTSMELWNIDGTFTRRIGGALRQVDARRQSSEISFPYSLNISPDGKHLAVDWGSNTRATEIRSLDGSVSRLFTPVSGSGIKGEPVYQDSVTKLAFTSEANLGFFYRSGRTQIYDLYGSLLSNTTGSAGSHAATDSRDRKIKVGTDGYPKIYAQNGTIIASLDAPYTRATAFSPDSRLFLTAAGFMRDRTMRLWTSDGKLVKTMEAADVVHLAVFGPDGKNFLVATDNVLSLWSIDGKLLKKFEGHSGTIRNAVYSPDGKYVISSSDVTICIWNLANNEYISYLRQGDEWVLYSPDGYFDASRNGGSLVAMAKGLTVWGIDQFAIRNNRPDILLSKLGIGSPELIAHYKNQYLKRLRKAGLTEKELSSDLHVPDASIVQQKQSDKFMDITFVLSDSLYNLKKYNVYVNDVPLFGAYGKKIEGSKVTRTERFELTGGRNKIEVSAQNEHGAESYRAVTFADYGRKTTGNLYFVGFGVKQYKDKTLNLKYAEKDVRDLAELAAKMKGKIYNDVFVRTYVDKDVTFDTIKSIKNSLLKTGTDDTVILFIAGHGLHDTDKDATYYYLTYNTDLHDLARTAVDFEQLEDLLQGIPARNKLFLMDTCESGEIDDARQKRFYDAADARGLSARAIRGIEVRPTAGTAAKKATPAKREYLLQGDHYIYNDLSRRSGAIVFSSSRGGEFSYESDKIQNGYFTREIINAFTRKEADKNRDGIVSTDELRDYVSRTVADKTGDLQHPTVDRDNLYQKFGFPGI